MNVDQLVVLLRQLEADVEGLNGILAGELEVRDRTGGIGAHLQGVFQQLLTLGIAENAVLRERNDLDVDEILDLFTQLQQSLHGGQLGIVDIHVGTNVLDPVGGLHTDRLVDAVLDLLLGQEGLILFPALDPLEQGAAHIPAGTARGQAGIQMHVRLDDGGQRQLAAAVYDLFAGQRGQVRGDLFKLSVGHTDIHGLGGVFNVQVFEQHNFHSSLEINCKP